jgi:hypothetical protein
MSVFQGSAIQELSRQWSGNARLRLGVWLVLGLGWLYVWLLANDWTRAAETQRQAALKEISALEPVKRSAGQWTRREQEVSEAMTRLRALSWLGSERGIIEANVQDWLRAATTRAKLNLREVRVLPDAGSGPGALPAPPEGIAVLSDRLPKPMRFRLVVEFRRLEAMALLVDLARQEPLVSVDRLQFRTQTQPAMLELELRVLGVEGKANP